MTDKITPGHRLEMARLNLEQAKLAYAKALTEARQISLDDSQELTRNPLEHYAELERLRDEARKHGGFSFLR